MVKGRPWVGPWTLCPQDSIHPIPFQWIQIWVMECRIDPWCRSLHIPMNGDPVRLCQQSHRKLLLVLIPMVLPAQRMPEETRKGPWVARRCKIPSFERQSSSHLSSSNSSEHPFASSQMPPWMNGQYPVEDNMFYPPWYSAFMAHMQGGGGSPTRPSNRDHDASNDDYDPRFPNHMNARENPDHEYYYQNHP